MSEESIVLNGDNLTLTHTYPFRIGLMSDIHIGAVHSIFPKGFKDPYGAPYGLNPEQEKLWEYFEDFLTQLNKCKINTLIILGDLIAGKNRIEGGVYMMNVDLEIQKKACVFFIQHITETVPSIEKILIFRGTPYHGARESSIEESITDKLKSEGINAKFMGEYSYLKLQHNGYEKVLWLAHPATGATIYPEMAMGRDIGHFLQAYAEGKLPKVDMIIRAHKHEFMELHKSTIRYMILPCWQCYVPYDQAVKWYSKWQPDIGGAILLADDHLRLRPWHFTYPNIVTSKRIRKLTQAGASIPLNQRPPCPRCGKTNIMSRGRQWHCKDCGKYWNK